MHDVSILISPTGSEIVIPVFDNKMERIHRFIGTETANVYNEAKLRNNQEQGILRTRLEKLSELPKILSWFTFTAQQQDTLTDVTMNWMFGCAERLRDSGHKSEAIVCIDDVNQAIEESPWD